MKAKNVFLIIAIVVLLLIAAALYSAANQASNNGGAPVSASTSTQPIQVELPAPDSYISSPLKVRGQARGSWYFEASFPIMVVDWDGRIIGQGQAKATSDWMTDELVPFEGSIDFTKPADMRQGTFNEKGTVIFKKDNPSGLPQNDAAVEVPVKLR